MDLEQFHANAQVHSSSKCASIHVSVVLQRLLATLFQSPFADPLSLKPSHKVIIWKPNLAVKSCGLLDQSFGHMSSYPKIPAAEPVSAPERKSYIFLQLWCGSPEMSLRHLPVLKLAWKSLSSFSRLIERVDLNELDTPGAGLIHLQHKTSA